MKTPALPETGTIALGAEKIVFSVTRSRKRKRTIAFKMQSDHTLHVIAPLSASLRSLTRILQKRAAWIGREMALRPAIDPQNQYTDGSYVTYLGHRCRLRVTQGDSEVRFCRLTPHILSVHVPDATLSPEGLRQEVRLEVTLWLKKRARVLFARRLDLWARKMGVAYKKLVIADAERRWGSCSVDNIIRLNWRLMMVPLPVLDYVVAHELAHIRHKDHSPRFWGFVGQAIPDYNARRRTLRLMERTILG